MRLSPATLVPALLIASASASLAQQALTLAEVERKYRKMNEVHILKCDHDGDRLFTRTEMLCVESIYRSFYFENS
jgi:hypothetical protein